MPPTDDLGSAVRRLREQAGMRRPGLAVASGVPLVTVWAVETRHGRVRVGTLRALAVALSSWSPGLGTPESLLGGLVARAGPRIAPETGGRNTAPSGDRGAWRRRAYSWLDARGARGWESAR